jgi:hypothetical protein
MGKQKRKRIDAENKIRILQSHLMDKKPVSEDFNCSNLSQAVIA